MSNPKLTLLSPPFTGKTFDLTQAKYSVGRTRNNDIVIEHSTVSSIHCELVRKADGTYSVIDNGKSTNGTRISGKLVSEYTLRDNDIIQLGGIECMFDDSSDDASSITSIGSGIRIATNPIIPNQDIDIAPMWLRTASTNMGVALRVLIALLALVVLVLSMVMTLHVIS